MHAKKYDWGRLNHLQVGRYAEYFVKMELALHGLDIFTTEVDNKGIDFVARNERGDFFEFQVKSLRALNYVFFPKDTSPLKDNLYAALVILLQGQPPQFFLIPAATWSTPSPLLVGHDYKGKKSPPEWGMNLSRKNWRLLEEFAADKMIHKIIGQDR